MMSRRTRVRVPWWRPSADGLNFNLPADGGQAGHGTLPVTLGKSYFRVFEEAGNYYAFSNTGDIWASPDPANPWTPPVGYDYSKDYWDRDPSNSFVDRLRALGWPELRPRHFAVMRRGDILYAILTYKSGRPERVSISTFDFSELESDYETWSGDFPGQELLKVEEVWEGALFPPLPPEAGSEDDGVNQLRDPEAFTDADGRSYLFYTGPGEDGIGLARLVAAPAVTGVSEVTTGQDFTYSVVTDVDVDPVLRRISHTNPMTVSQDAEGAGSGFSYAGSGGYSFVQSATVAAGTQSFQLAHLAAEADETLTFLGKYYATPGALLRFSSRLAGSTVGQVGELQVSFDGALWQTIWQRIGGGSRVWV